MADWLRAGLPLDRSFFRSAPAFNAQGGALTLIRLWSVAALDAEALSWFCRCKTISADARHDATAYLPSCVLTAAALQLSVAAGPPHCQACGLFLVMFLAEPA